MDEEDEEYEEDDDCRPSPGYLWTSACSAFDWDQHIQYCLQCLPQRRLARDGWDYTCAAFLDYYGPARGGWEWHRSPVFIPPEHDRITRMEEVNVWMPETRVAPDGTAWRCEDFLSFYGTERGAWIWHRAPVARYGDWELAFWEWPDVHHLSISAPGVTYQWWPDVEYLPTRYREAVGGEQEFIEAGVRIYVTPGEASHTPGESP